MNSLQRLQEFYVSNCNGDWEHQQGIKISTLDNPGWRVSISLVETKMEGKMFNSIARERSEADWIFCSLENNVFNGAGSASNLEEILLLFLDWVDS